MTRPDRAHRRRFALAAILLVGLSGAAGCTGLQSWVGDVQDLGPAVSQWGTDVFGDTAPEW